MNPLETLRYAEQLLEQPAPTDPTWLPALRETIAATKGAIVAAEHARRPPQHVLRSDAPVAGLPADFIDQDHDGLG